MIKELVYTKHAIIEAQTDKFGLITLPAKLDLSKATKFNKNGSLVLKYSFDNKTDVCYVVREAREKDKLVLITVYRKLKEKHVKFIPSNN